MEVSSKEITACDGKIVRVTAADGRCMTGIAAVIRSSANDAHGFGSEEWSLCVNGCSLYGPDIAGMEVLPAFAILRAKETWQQAGAYYVRIQAMAKKHHITLREEFDEHDTPETGYIVVTDADFPVATARMYPLGDGSVMIGRVVVLPEYRRRGIGTMVVCACEEWAAELGYGKAVLESRDNKLEFYRQMGYEVTGEPEEGETFRCVRMEKELRL